MHRSADSVSRGACAPHEPFEKGDRGSQPASASTQRPQSDSRSGSRRLRDAVEPQSIFAQHARCTLSSRQRTHGDHTRSLARLRYGIPMAGRMVDDIQGGCGSREPAAARRAPEPDESGCRCASHISDGRRGLPPGEILRRLAASHHHRPPLRASAGSECQGTRAPSC